MQVYPEKRTGHNYCVCGDDGSASIGTPSTYIRDVSGTLHTQADAWSLLTALLLLSCVRGSGGGARYARSLAVG